MPDVNLKGTVVDSKVWYNGNLLDPGPSQAVHNHSPDGFSWGYSGSGPAQLALAILIQACDKHDLNYTIAINNYQRFKERILSYLDINDDFDFNINLEGYLK